MYHGIPTMTIDEKIDAAVKNNGQKKVYVSYAAGPTDENDDHIDNLHEIAAKGKIILVAQSDDFYGGPKSKNYQSEILENPTWLQICVCANAMIRCTRNTHHVFLEGIEKKSIINNVTTYEFLMGS